MDKARRVQAAGAVGCIIVNSNDKAWRPGGHTSMPAGAATADADEVDIPVLICPVSIAFSLKPQGTVVSLAYGAADTDSLSAKSLFQSAARVLGTRRREPGEPGERKLPLALGDDDGGAQAGAATVTLCAQLPSSLGAEFSATVADWCINQSESLTGRAAIVAEPYLLRESWSSLCGRVVVIGRGGPSFVDKAVR